VGSWNSIFSSFPIPHSLFPTPHSHLALTSLFTYTLPTLLKSPFDQLYDQRE
jgi:hypothetical protein